MQPDCKVAGRWRGCVVAHRANRVGIAREESVTAVHMLEGCRPCEGIEKTLEVTAGHSSLRNFRCHCVCTTELSETRDLCK